MSDYKERLASVVDELEEALAEEKVKNNRLTTENTRIKNSVARMIELFEEGAKICQTLKS